MARVTAVTTKTVIDSTAFGNALVTDYVSQTDTGTQAILSDLTIGVQALERTLSTETLGVGIATFAVTGEAKVMTGDGGANVVTTITGGRTGQVLYLIFTDGNITMTNDDGHGANTLDLAGNLVSADDTTLTLIFDGTSWYELARSVN